MRADRTIRKERHGRRTSRVLGFALIAGLAFAVPLASSAKPKPKPKLKPDLIVTEAKLLSEPYLFAWEENPVETWDRTKNIGKGRAKRSDTYGVLRNPDTGFQLAFIIHQVPALKPHESHGAKISDIFAYGTFHWGDFLGGYAAEVCANWDRRLVEKRYGNNCTATGDQVGIISRKFVGTVDGTAPLLGGDVTETWHATTTWTFDHFVKPATFVYDLEQATVHWTDSGAHGGCTYSGDGTATIVGGSQLTLTYGRSNTYSALAVLAPPLYPAYTIHQQCAHNTYDGPGPVWAPWFMTSGGGAAAPISPHHGYTALSDTFPMPDGSATYKWNLTPDD